MSRSRISSTEEIIKALDALITERDAIQSSIMNLASANDFINVCMNTKNIESFRNPSIDFVKDAKAGKYDNLSDDEYEAKCCAVEADSEPYHGQQVVHINTLIRYSKLLSLYSELNQTMNLLCDDLRILITGSGDELPFSESDEYEICNHIED